MILFLWNKTERSQAPCLSTYTVGVGRKSCSQSLDSPFEPTTMLTLTESESRRQHAAAERKRQKGKKKIKQEKTPKRVVMVNEKLEVEEKDTEEHLEIHELMPVTYKPDDQQLHQTEVTFEQATEQECTTVAALSCMDPSTNSNKFVIITLLEPTEQQTITDEYVTSGEIREVDDKTKCTKLQKKVLLLHKIDSQGNATLEASPQATIEEVKDVKDEFENQLVTINFSDLASPVPADGKEQKDLGNWIKKFPALALCYTESGKPYVKCPSCTAMYFKASSFEKHVSLHLRKQDELYICNFCKYNSADANAIFDHLTIHQDQCEVCNMNLTRKNSFKKHWEFSESQITFTVKRDRWGRFICIYCKLGFDLCHQLQKHWFKHSCNSSKTSQCNNCSGLFDNDEALQNHVCLKCPVCGKVLDSVHRLRSHCRYEKHYVYCQICTYEFILSVDLDKHMALHKKPYQTHKDYAHCLESEDGTSFQCGVCGKIYHTMSCLVLHINDDHKLDETARTITEDELQRISLPDGKEVTASYDMIETLKGEVDFERACEEVLEAQTSDRTSENAEPTGDDQCEPVALCWNRYSIEEETIRKDT